MVRRQDRFSGNILLYDYIATKRAPVFLNRNLIRALKIHHQLSEGIVYTDDQFGLRSVWKPPSLEALDYMMQLEKSKGSFVLDVHRIVPTNVAAIKPSPRHAEQSAKARRLPQSEAQLKVSIFPLSQERQRDLAPQTATLYPTRITRGNDRSVSIETPRITIPPASLEGKGDCPQAKLDGSYTIPIQIGIHLSNDAMELFAHLTPGCIASLNASQQLSASWPDILRVPKEKRLIGLSNWTGDVGLGLEVTMFWASIAGNSPLGEHNRRMRQSQTPSMLAQTPQPDKVRRPMKATYKYDDKIISMDSLSCPHQHKEKRTFNHVDELRMHFDSYHDNLTYQANNDGSDEDGIEHWTFICEPSQHTVQRGGQRSSARADEPFDNFFVAPATPFNQKQHLDEGNDDFQRMGRSTKSGPEAVLTRRGSTAQTERMPGQVPTIPHLEKKKYPVPAAPPGVTFFRSFSRRPLVTGEYISESDDEVDDAWIRSRKSAEFNKKAGLSSNAKDFLKAYDNHMRSEQLHSDVHVGDAVFRFARERGGWLWKKHLSAVFKEKLNELSEDHIITKAMHEECLEIFEKARIDMVEEDSEVTERLTEPAVRQTSHDSLYDDPSPPRANVSRTGTGHRAPVTTDSDGDLEMREAAVGVETNTAKKGPPLPYDLCLCSEDAQASYRESPFIACSSITCIRRTFHYDCIKERWKITQNFRALRKSAWVCEDCRPNSAIGN